MKITHCLYAALVGVVAVLPQVTQAADPSLQGLIVGTNDFVNTILIPAVLAIAFFIFVVNVVRFFIIGGANEEGQKNAKALALYSIGAFVFILTFWGIVNLLNDGLGLNNDPCYPTSDYINSDGTSCPPPADVTIDTGGFGTGVPSSPVSGSGIIIPGSDTPPTVPQPPPPITSFDLDGSPFGDTTAQLLAAQTALEVPTATFLAEKNASLFGYNTPVTEELFASLLEPVSLTNSMYDQAAAAYRLNQLGAISSADFNGFISAINAYDAAIGTPRPPLTVNALAAQVLPLPERAQSNIGATQDLLRAEITAYNERVSVLGPVYGIDANDMIASLYDQNVSITERRLRLDAIYDDPNAQIITDGGDEIYNRFNDDLNMEAVFGNKFQEIN